MSIQSIKTLSCARNRWHFRSLAHIILFILSRMEIDSIVCSVRCFTHMHTYRYIVTIDKLFNFALDACFRGGASSLINSIINSNFRNHQALKYILHTAPLSTDDYEVLVSLCRFHYLPSWLANLPKLKWVTENYQYNFFLATFRWILLPHCTLNGKRTHELKPYAMLWVWSPQNNITT